MQKFYMQLLNKGKELNEDTFNYVQNVYTQGGNYYSPLINKNKLDLNIANKMFKEIGFWELKFREGLYNALNHWETFYINKLKTMKPN